MRTLNLFLPVFLFSSVILGANVSDIKVQLEKRCFVWAPSHCTDAHRKADQNFIREVSKGRPPAEASPEVVKQGWNLLREKKDALHALFRFNQALILDEKNADAWWGAGNSYTVLALPLNGEPLLRKAITLDPKLSGPHLSLAVALKQMGKVDEAQKEYGQALGLGAPSDGDLAKELGIGTSANRH